MHLAFSLNLEINNIEPKSNYMIAKTNINEAKREGMFSSWRTSIVRSKFIIVSLSAKINTAQINNLSIKFVVCWKINLFITSSEKLIAIRNF